MNVSLCVARQYRKTAKLFFYEVLFASFSFKKRKKKKEKLLKGKVRLGKVETKGDTQTKEKADAAAAAPLPEPSKGYGKYVTGFLKWLSAGLLIGLLGGILGGAFHRCVEIAGELRQTYPWLIWFMPAGGLLIISMYQGGRASLDTNAVIRAIHTSQPVRALMAPLIFVSSVISHLVGASVGREGAALQIGGATGYQIGRLFRADERDRHILVMCGMSAVFAANFGTGVTAAFFPMEVASVGVIYYAGLLPCLTASLTAAAVAHAMGAEAFTLPAVTVPEAGPLTFAVAAILGLACAFLSMLFCRCLHDGERLTKKYLPNPYIRVLVLSLAALGLSLLSGTGDYNGAGVQVIASAVSGEARPEAFLLKLVLTVLCVCAGFKGGEIVPTLFIGACFGCVLGTVLPMDAGFCAALCAVGLFGAMVNCPMTTLLLSIELFGAEPLPFFAVAIAISYMMSADYSLYLEQSVIYSKIKAAYINRHTR